MAALQASSISVAAPSRDATSPSLDGFLAGVERRAYRLAQLALGNREDALDAVQDSMLKLMAYRDRAEDQWSPLFWSIFRRQLTDRYRRAAVRRRVLVFFGNTQDQHEDPLERVADPHADPAQRQQDAEAWSALGGAVRALPARQRECFLLRELQGLSVAETAAAMGCSEGSVKTHLSRALAALRDKMEVHQ